MKGIIYYTDNKLNEPIYTIVQKQILKSNLPIVSVSLKPIDFGNNFVVSGYPGIVMMVKQITLALKESKADYVFFCEHDCLYPLSHFDFTPPSNGIFYYNENVWRWKYPEDYLISYDRLISLSGLCVNRKFALKHYTKRLVKIHKMNYYLDQSHEPLWARRWGYEPGTKKRKRGGFSDDDFRTWKSADPIIDIRHGKTFSQSKVTLDSFIHKPENWQETDLKSIKGWNLKEMFNL